MSLNEGKGRVTAPAAALSKPRSAAPALSPHLAVKLVCLALLLAAPVFALTTWQVEYSFLAIRHLSAPIVAAQIIIIGLAMSSGSEPFKIWRGLSRPVQVAFCVFGLVASVATFLADAAPSFAIIGLLGTGVHLLFLAVCYERFAGKWFEMRGLVLWSLAIGAAVYFIIVYGLALSQHDNQSFSWAQLSPGVSNIRQLGFYGLTASGIGAGLLAMSQSRKEATFAFIVATLGVWCVFTSGGRAAAGGLLALLCVTVLFSRHRNGLMLFGQLSLSLILAMLASLIFVPDPRWGIVAILSRIDPTYTSQSEFSSGRVDMWIETFQAVLEKPVFGHGQSQFRHSMDSSSGFWNHPHNSVLQALFDWGFIGTAALAVLAILALKRTMTALKTDLTLALPALSALTGLLAMSLLEGSLYHVYPTMVILTCLAVILTSASRGISHD